MIPAQQAPFLLTAMTLRGIGSYLHGSRLDLKPLTILCGKNGSGKSTWLKALNLLKNSLAARRLPYGFCQSDTTNDDIEFTNAFYFLAGPEDHEQFSSEKETGEFGPPGTIGMEVILARDFQLPVVPTPLAPGMRPPECVNECHEFLWKGSFREGTRVRLRVAHPAHVEDAVHTPELLDLIELSFDDEHVLRLKGPREPAQHFSDGQRGPRRAFPYTLSCSPAYLPRAQQSFADLVDVAELTDINRRLVKPVSEGIVASDATMLLDFFEARFCQILKIALDGFFYLGAIRPQHDYL